MPASLSGVSPRQYEAFVSELIAHLEAFRGASISRNKKFKGVRQPGHYEIDVAVEFCLGDCLQFLVVVECKRWNRPVGREVIQRLVQTRDAVAAHKAVVCSPVGFTKEAVAVAKSHGVALWIIAQPYHSISMVRNKKNVHDAGALLRLLKGETEVSKHANHYSEATHNAIVKILTDSLKFDQEKCPSWRLFDFAALTTFSDKGADAAYLGNFSLLLKGVTLCDPLTEGSAIYSLAAEIMAFASERV